jgi:hypothetical protein
MATDIWILGDTANRETVRTMLTKRQFRSSSTAKQEQELENKLVREANQVALKVMSQLDQFERTLSPGEWWEKREANGSSTLDEAHVINVIRSHKVRQRQLRQMYPSELPALNCTV